MPSEWSRRGDMVENTYIDPGAVTAEAYAISLRSREKARAIIGNSSAEDRIRQRCSIAVGDMSMASLMRFNGDPAIAGIEALRRNAPIFTDIRMVQVGILKKLHHSQVTCALDFGEKLAMSEGMTRTSAGFITLEKELNSSVVVIGNAPSALLVVCDLIRKGIVPALIVGTPVGFVNAAESKEVLRTMDVPSISTEGTRGGTPIAVAAINEIIVMYGEACDAQRSGH